MDTGGKKIRKRSCLNLRTTKVIDRLTYCPQKHKQKCVRTQRKQLQAKHIVSPPTPNPTSNLKFGSFNVNGLDIEASWAVEQLLTTRGFDVGYI